MNTKVEPRVEVPHEPKVSPADRLVSGLDGTFYKLTEAADIVGVSPTTLRRLMRRPELGVKAPSFKVRQGGMAMYLYSEDDITELKLYFAASRLPAKR